MDTTEELYGYFYAGMPNLSAGELFFWITVDETMKQLGVDDVGAVVGILLGRNNIPTRQKPIGAIRGTSVASIYSRKLLNYNLPFNILPTFVGGPVTNLKFRLTNNLGAFVGRSVPFVGWIILAHDVCQIIYKTVVHYNIIARSNDKLWN